MNFPQSSSAATVSLRRRESTWLAIEPMANRNEKNPGNVPGQFYVDSTCIDCGMCPDNAPAFFRGDVELGMSVVFRQPTTDEEWKLASEALESCPTLSIGDDGDETR
jgi:ferredoxin